MTQTGCWEILPGASAVDRQKGSGAPHLRVIEVAPHPGVTNTTTDELVRLTASMDLGLAGIASGRRFTVAGDLTEKDLDRLIRLVLANPVIEQWRVDSPLTPVFTATTCSSHSEVEQFVLDLPGTLAQLNEERQLALDPIDCFAITEFFTNHRPATDVELEMIAQTWSEHCAHTTFRAQVRTEGGPLEPSLLERLRRSTEGIGAPFVRSAFTGNAGIIGFHPDHTIAVKCETHNRPSAIEPFGGANTGVGGVIRDILGAGHQPIACTDVVCFGLRDTPAVEIPAGVLPPSRVRAGVIAGIADYGNKIGLPTIAGAVIHDPGYLTTPLVFAGCIGRADAWREEQVPRPGDRVIVIGGRTGRDGLRGATFSSRAMDSRSGTVSGASVQIGAPLTEKQVMSVLAEINTYYRAITDCGAGGLSSAVGEMADGVGAEVDLSEVPLKYPGLAPWEVWLSEAQERMVLAVPPASVAVVEAACTRHGIDCHDLGSFTGDNRLRVRWHGTLVVNLDLDFLHRGRPQRVMDATRPVPVRTPERGCPSWLRRWDPATMLCALLAHPTIASKADVVRCYDYEVRGATAVRPLIGGHLDGHSDAAVLVEPGQTHGLAVGIGVNPWFGMRDPQRMAEAVVDEAIRNVVAVGADPTRIALLDNFAWADPRNPTTMGSLAAAVDGCCAAAERYRAPFVSGKDSLRNVYRAADGRVHEVPPTLVITAVAAIPDVAATVTAAATRAGNRLLLVGTTQPEFGGSHAALIGAPGTVAGRVHSAHQHDGVVPAPDLAAPARYRAVHAAIRMGLVAACHDLSEGGLAVAVAEMCLAGHLGADLDPVPEPAIHLFSESTGRLLLEVAPDDVVAVQNLLADAVPVGTLTEQPRLTLPDGTAIDLAVLRAHWTGAGPA